MVITDHHVFAPELPEADVLVHPSRLGRLPVRGALQRRWRLQAGLAVRGELRRWRWRPPHLRNTCRG
ncbi:MAG: hypothetical protein U0800_07130 [Isosphaeraceae bacterium]